MSRIQKSTIVRIRSAALRSFLQYGGYVAPRPAGRLARDLWFAAPPRMAELPVPDGGQPFEVHADGRVVRGQVWTPRHLDRRGNEPRTVYLVHGWGGRGSQFGAMVEPLLRTGRRVLLFDSPAHGDSDHGPSGPRRTNGVEFAKALEAVFCRFGPADAVVAHSLGTISTYLALRFGWLGTERLVFIAPMVESESLLAQFQHALGFGPRVRRAFDRSLLEWIGIPVSEFDARVQAAQVEPMPTLVVTDRGDRQTAYAEVADFARVVGARLVTTDGLGHRKILRDPSVIQAVADFVAEDRDLEHSA